MSCDDCYKLRVRCQYLTERLDMEKVNNHLLQNEVDNLRRELEKLEQAERKRYDSWVLNPERKD